MSLLTDTDIRAKLSNDKHWQDRQSKLHIYPYSEECLTPVGYDLRVGEQYASSIDAEMYDLAADGEVQIRPGDVVLIRTMETIDMPEDLSLSAFITSKVSKVSKGLSHISTNVDPDWQGNLLIAIHNPSLNTIVLPYGEPFCTINFVQNVSASTKTSGKPPGRTDILLREFVDSLKKAKHKRDETQQLVKMKAKRRRRTVLIAKVLVVVGAAAAGFHFFQNSPGFIACTAIGVGLASLMPTPEVEK